MAQNGMFLFTGKNRFGIENERRRWEKEFCERHGEENLLRRQGTGLKLRELLDDVSVAPFLAEKRLVTVDGLPALSKEDVGVLTKALHPDVVLLFVERPTRGKSSAKDLAAVCMVKQFPEMRTPGLIAWAVARAAEAGCTMDTATARRLVELLEGDQQFIDTEIAKLATAFPGETVTQAQVEATVLPLAGVPWSMTDAVLARDPAKAVLTARTLLRTGTDVSSLWHAALSLAKNLCAVTAALEAGVPSSEDVAERTGVHPFVLRNMLPLARGLRTADLAPLIETAVRYDTDIKTGRLRSTDDADEELCAALDVILLRFPQASSI